jgi:Uncharacterized homolog of phage Mu protein gp47
MDDFSNIYDDDIEEILNSEDFEFESIVERMKNDLTNPTSKIEGSFCMDVIQAVAMEISRSVTMRVIDYIDQTMLDTSEGEFLDRKALDYAIERISAIPSSGYVTFLGDEGTIIPKGTTVESDEFTFITNNEAIIKNGSAEVLCICSEGGSETNVSEESITIITDDIIGLDSCVNHDSFSGGRDEEDDEVFRERILEKIQLPISSGNANSYVYWAKQVSGVGNARVIPLWHGQGTVQVIIVGNDGLAPSYDTVKNVQDYIETQRPIGASVSVSGARAKGVYIEANVVLEDGHKIDQAKEDITNVVRKYLTTIAFDSNHKKLSYYRISDLIFNVSGVSDIINYTINGSNQSIVANYDEFFQLEEVSLNAN